MIVSRASVTGFAARRPARRSAAGMLRIATWLTVAGLAMSGCGSTGSNPISSRQSSSTSSVQTAASSVNALIAAGIAQADAKRYPEAETTFRDVLIVDPGNKFAWYNLGLLAEVQNRRSDALAYYSKALAADPRYTPAMYNKAILLEGIDLHSALALYQRITTINPKAATAYLRESFVYDRLGDKAKASHARARAVALDRRLATVTGPAPAGSK